MRSFQVVGRALLTLFLSVSLYTLQAQAAEDASFLTTAFKSSSSHRQSESGMLPALRATRSRAAQADLYHENSIDPGRMTAYGYDFYESASTSDRRKKMRVRGGVSGLSAKAAAGVQMIVDW